MGDPFEAIVGAGHVSRAEQETVCGARVAAVVRPGSADEVAACLRAASESAIALLPVGGGTGLGLGNPLDAASCVRLELGRLCAPAQLDPDEGVGEVEAGVTLEALARAAAASGKSVPFDPLRAGATVGGTIAVDPLTPDAPERRLRGDLLGLELALPNGELTRCGGRVVKNVTGFDLVRLYCGSFGSLGVVTRAVLRLRAAPERTAVTRARFPSLEAALAAAAEAVAPESPLAAAVRPVAGGAELWLRAAGSAAEVEAELAHAPGDSVEPAAWSAVRDELAQPPAPAGARVQLGARPSDLPVLVRGLCAAAGDSSLRLALPRAGIALGRVPLARVPALVELAARAGAALLIERTPGAALACDAFGPPPPALALMRALKARFDPARVLSPGRFVAGI
ncbi:MAG TPA: FAD-binding oxidoreductase [Myxococcota bacterium]|nr:FAD-binding oxidoreductase [Myxococcota bacterium]